MYSLNSEELIACSTVDDIVASPEAIAAIKNNRHALEFSKKNFKLSYATGVASDESVLAAGMGYLKYNVGDTVTLKYGDVDKQFVVAHKNYITQNKIVLVSVDILGTSKWSNSKNDYTSSTLRTYLNSTVLNSFSPEIQAAMVSTELPCHNYTTATTCKDKVWALSYTETGFYGNGYAVTEGRVLDFFNGQKNLIKGQIWWLRTPHTKSTAVVWGIKASFNRAEDRIGVTNDYGVVCAFEI